MKLQSFISYNHNNNNSNNNIIIIITLIIITDFLNINKRNYRIETTINVDSQVGLNFYSHFPAKTMARLLREHASI